MEGKDRSTSPIRREEIQMISEDEKIRIPLDSAVKCVILVCYVRSHCIEVVHINHAVCLTFALFRDGANASEIEDGEKSKEEEKKKRAVGVFELVRSLIECFSVLRACVPC